jgi:excisionase family DNA binding protein
MTRSAVDEKPGWVNVKEAARTLDVSTSVIYRAVAAGTLPALRLTGGTIRIPRDALTSKQVEPCGRGRVNRVGPDELDLTRSQEIPPRCLD